MLRENLKNLRKAKGFSQEELALKLNVVRQTVSKWEKGLSVPDSEMLIRIAEELDTTAAELLGETVEKESPEDLRVLSAKLELLNEQFARQNEKRRKIWRAFFIVLGILAVCFLLSPLVRLITVQLMMRSAQKAGVSIIGGADGPTAVMAASMFWPTGRWFAGILAASAAGLGIYGTRRK